MSEHAGVRVLIIEDEASIRRGLSDVLRFRGCEVAVAENGVEGLRLGISEPWDLIVLELMRPHIEREGFSVQLTTADTLPEVQLDVDALKQMLFNVLDNALKYGRGDAASQIDVTCVADSSGGVTVSVRDYGRGVSEAQLQTVFEPFFRGESELTRRQQGTGLGLALVRDLVALMRGSVHGQNRAPGFEVQISLRAA